MAKKKKKMAKSNKTSLLKVVSNNKLLLFVAIFAVAGGLYMALTSYAAVKGGKSKGSIELVVVTGGDSTPNFGEEVTFNVSTSATTQPYVNLRCFKDGKFVLDGWAGYFEGAWFDRNFTLSNSVNNAWTSGAADCVADLVSYGKNGRKSVLSTLNFIVAP